MAKAKKTTRKPKAKAKAKAKPRTRKPKAKAAAAKARFTRAEWKKLHPAEKKAARKQGLAPKPKRRTKATAATTTTRKRRTSRTGKGKAKRRVSRRRKGLFVVRGTMTKLNPVVNSKSMVAVLAGLGLGAIAANIVDRFAATMAPGGTGGDKPLYGEAAAAAINKAPDTNRYIAQAIGAGVTGIGAYVADRQKYTPLAYGLGGACVGFLMKLGGMALETYVAPKVFKIDTDTANDSWKRRIFPTGSMGSPYLRARQFVPRAIGPVAGPRKTGNVGCGCGCQKAPTPCPQYPQYPVGPVATFQPQFQPQPTVYPNVEKTFQPPIPVEAAPTANVVPTFTPATVAGPSVADIIRNAHANLNRRS